MVLAGTLFNSTYSGEKSARLDRPTAYNKSLFFIDLTLMKMTPLCLV